MRILRLVTMKNKFNNPYKVKNTKISFLKIKDTLPFSYKVTINVFSECKKKVDFSPQSPLRLSEYTYDGNRIENPLKCSM